MDLDSSGFINYTEWLAATVGKSVLKSPGAARAAFMALDNSGNDVISHEDLSSTILISPGRAP